MPELQPRHLESTLTRASGLWIKPWGRPRTGLQPDRGGGLKKARRVKGFLMAGAMPTISPIRRDAVEERDEHGPWWTWTIWTRA